MAGPALYAFHRLVIAMAIALGAVFALWCALEWRRTGDGWLAALGVASLAAGVALGFYLRWFLRKRAARAP